MTGYRHDRWARGQRRPGPVFRAFKFRHNRRGCAEECQGRGTIYEGVVCHAWELNMGLLGWALIFLIVSGIAAIFGFGGVASASAGIAKILFFVFLVIFVVLLILGLLGVGAVAA
jgi:uncharacterized membrane protein YtjA (UPF0391 family)